MSEEFAHKKKLWIYTSVDPVAFSFVHLQLFFTWESVSLMLHLKKKILFSITAAIILGSMPLSGNAREAEPEISSVSLQQAPDQTDVSAADRTKYDGYIWRLDAKDRDQLPRRFRTANSAFRSHVDVKKTGKGFTMTPSRKGLDRLNISGSALSESLRSWFPYSRSRRTGQFILWIYGRKRMVYLMGMPSAGSARAIGVTSERTKLMF